MFFNLKKFTFWMKIRNSEAVFVLPKKTYSLEEKTGFWLWRTSFLKYQKTRFCYYICHKKEDHSHQFIGKLDCLIWILEIPVIVTVVFMTKLCYYFYHKECECY